jgi:hypothetical protein
MKNLILKVMTLGVFLLCVNQSVEAQGFLKKLTKGSSESATKTEATTENASESTDSVKSLKWDMIPVYTAKKVNVTDENGNQLKNEDGTPITRVFLVDQFGNKRSAEAVKEQHKKINKAIGRILLKVGGGAALGVAGGLLDSKGKASGGVIGGVAGAAAGLALSAKDIKQAKAQKKSLKEQEKLVEAYQKAFTAEGTPVDASVNLADVDGIDFTAGDAVSETAESLKAELANTNFNSSDDSSWTI